MCIIIYILVLLGILGVYQAVVKLDKIAKNNSLKLKNSQSNSMFDVLYREADQSGRYGGFYIVHKSTGMELSIKIYSKPVVYIAASDYKKVTYFSSEFQARKVIKNIGT